MPENKISLGDLLKYMSFEDVHLTHKYEEIELSTIVELDDNEGFDCESYSTWVCELCYDLMRLTGLIETFEEAHKILELYISETIRGYRILTQDGYGTQE